MGCVGHGQLYSVVELQAGGPEAKLGRIACENDGALEVEILQRWGADQPGFENVKSLLVLREPGPGSVLFDQVSQRCAQLA